MNKTSKVDNFFSLWHFMTVFGLKIRFNSKLVTINQTQQTIFLRVAVWKWWTKKKSIQMVQNFGHSTWRFYPKRKVPSSPNPIEMALIGAWILCNIHLEDYLRIRYDFFSWPNPLCLIHHGRHLFIPGILKPFTFEVISCLWV